MSEIGFEETLKRKPPEPLDPNLSLAIPNDFRSQRAMHLIHQPESSPCSSSLIAVIRDQVLKDCGVKKRMSANIRLHTAAMWMKIEGVSAWIVADFLGCGMPVLVERYGTWESLCLFEAASAMRAAATQGILRLM